MSGTGATGWRDGWGATDIGRRLLACAWSATPLGELDDWPVSLTTLVSTMLACPTPMFLAWGPDLNAIFNDAYLPILGQRAGDAMGKPFRALWGDIWSDIGPLVEETLQGRSRRMVDMLLDLQRDGAPEESWWSFTYSPVYDETGSIAGLLCVTGETTERVLAERARDAADERLQLALSAGNSIGAWDWDVVADRLVADTRFALLYGLDPARARAGPPLAEVFKGVHPDDLARVRTALDTAITSGGVFSEEYRLLGRDGRVHWVLAQGKGVADRTGRCVRIAGVSFDVSERVAATLALKAAKADREFVIALTGRQRELSSPDAIIRLTVEALGRRLAVDRCGFYRALPTGRVRAGPSWTTGALPPLAGDFDDEAFGARVKACWVDGVTLSYADSRVNEIGGLEPLAAMGVISGACVPVMHEGRFHAGIFLHGVEVRAWTASDLALAREVAELTLLAVERAEATIRLQNRVGQQENALAQQATELRDQTAGRSAAESQLHQLQKMEAVGQLTGGIAHDFNNMLAVVIGGLNLMQRRLERGDTNVGKYVEAAMDGATRAAALTQRLLAFSRQAPLAPEPIDVNRTIGGLTDLLDRTLGDNVRLETVAGAGLWRAKADPNQFENVVVNLAVNARDAMPDGGCLTIETSNVHIDDAYASEEGVAPGQYVQVAVTDTGSGMTREVMEKAFDPFFTTKGVGKGTGLGLSQVFGFVRQSGGHVKIYSELGHGTTVKVHLPRFFGDATAAAPRRSVTAMRGGDPSEVILVVEDEERLRAFAVEALRELGYTVVHAANGDEALAMIDAGQAATLLFTDVVMPGLTGRQLADAAVERLPGLKVIYTTGYTRNAVVHNGTLDPGTNFLAKPVALETLAAKVRDVLDHP